MNKRIFTLSLLFLFPLLTACSSASTQSAPNKQLMTLPDHSFISLTLPSQQLKVEVVNTAESTAQGLSDRTAIGSDGLLFAFPQKEYQRFWMNKMVFDLDLVWLSDLQVVDITANVPYPRTKDTRLPTYSPQKPVNEVLEILAGTAQKWNLKIGDTFGYSW